jgi:hypothetical protein
LIACERCGDASPVSLSNRSPAQTDGLRGLLERVKQRGVELPLALADHADWAELLVTMHVTAAPYVCITHGREAALAHMADAVGI